MLYIINFLNVYLNSLRKEEGQGMAEYALILAFIAVVAVIALSALNFNDLFSGIGESLSGAEFNVD